MSVNPLLLPITKDADTKRKDVLTNIVKMLAYRKWINQENVNKYIENIISENKDDDIYKIKLDNDLSTNEFYASELKQKDNTFDGKTVMIKLIHQKVTGINKSPLLIEFIANYKKYHKIVVVDDMPTTKVIQQLNVTPNTESFFESFFLINLMEHVCSPVYHVLNQKEQQQFYEEYEDRKNKLAKIYDNDPASLYLFVKKGQILRIERASEVTGTAVMYRIVVHRSNNKIPTA